MEEVVAVVTLAEEEEDTAPKQVADQTITRPHPTAIPSKLLNINLSLNRTVPSIQASTLLLNTRRDILSTRGSHNGPTKDKGNLSTRTTRDRRLCPLKTTIPTTLSTCISNSNSSTGHSNPSSRLTPLLLSSLMDSPILLLNSQVVRRSGVLTLRRSLLRINPTISSLAPVEVEEDITANPRHSQWARPSGWVLTMAQVAIPVLQ